MPMPRIVKRLLAMLHLYKWTRADYTRDPWKTRRATHIPARDFRWFYNEYVDPKCDSILRLMTEEERIGERERHHAHLGEVFGAIDIRQPAYDWYGKALGDDSQAVFVLKEKRPRNDAPNPGQ